MASDKTLERRTVQAVDLGRTVRPFFMQPVGFQNRQERRRRMRAKRLFIKHNPKPEQPVIEPPKDTASEAPE